jgi:hypothetical protein
VIDVARALWPELQIEGPQRLGRGEFSYVYRRTPAGSIWLMSFYDGMYFLVSMQANTTDDGDTNTGKA